MQKARFLDSILRGYPVPALFFERKSSPGLGGTPTVRHEIVHGQQRLIALRDYMDGHSPLLAVDGKSKLRLPRAIRERPAPWAGRVFDSLPADLKQLLSETKLTVFEISE